MPDCQFCSEDTFRGRDIFRNGLVRVFPTNIPIVPGHVIISPVRHAETFEELTEEESKEMLAVLQRVKRALQKAFGAQGFNYAWNEGKLAGQAVAHFHFHVVPRKEGDTGITEYEPRKFLYRPGSRAESPSSELEEVAALVENNF